MPTLILSLSVCSAPVSGAAAIAYVLKKIGLGYEKVGIPILVGTGIVCDKLTKIAIKKIRKYINNHKEGIYGYV